MKTIILAGGMGSRIQEETFRTPKPMITIGNKPILWHIMKIYSHHGFNNFIICAGYKQEVIKDYFVNYYLHHSDITVDLKNQSLSCSSSKAEDFCITVLDTGYDTLTGGRILQAQKYIDTEIFMIAYGDGIGNINIKDLVKFHTNRERIATLTAVTPQGRFGTLTIDERGKSVVSFKEKPMLHADLINSGFIVTGRRIFDYLKSDEMLETCLERLANEDELSYYHHTGYWQCMDTAHDRGQLEEQWKTGNAPWKIWE